MSRRTPVDEWSVREARNQFIRRLRRGNYTESTIRTYHDDLRQFVIWSEDNDIDLISELEPYDFELYQEYRYPDLAPTSLENQMGVVKRFIEFCEDVGAVQDGLADSIDVPRAPKERRSRDERLSKPDAIRLLQFYRDKTNGMYGSKWHAILEVAWHTGARLGGLRALDLQDYDRDELVLEFRHRPRQETPLKRKFEGERDVGILPEVGEALDAYIDGDRHDRHDEFGRAPLFTSRSLNGRLSPTAVRYWVYQATQPCWYDGDPCRHNKRREDCEWTKSGQSSKCPSSRSPHAVRTGSITFHRDCGFDAEATSNRCNASIRTIKNHYDKAAKREEMENRRRPQINKLSIENHDSKN